MSGYSMGRMGGYSLIVLAAVAAATTTGVDDAWVASLAVVMMGLANFMNHPHFVSSYKVFFEIYPSIRSKKTSRNYKVRWWMAAVAIPVALIILLAVGVRDAQGGEYSTLSIAVLLYGVSVGWHYVKQGFGMAMSEAALKKTYWQPNVRRWMLGNAYVCWLFSACLLFSGGDGFGILGYTFSIGRVHVGALVGPLGMIFLVTTIVVGIQIKRNLDYWLSQGVPRDGLPLAGLVGYVVTLYAWVAIGAAFPLLMLVIPFFHSLQYMHVVNKLYAKQEGTGISASKVARWIVLVVVGFLAFWLIPGFFDYIETGSINIVSQMGMLYTAAFWLFINIHHYFIDNVIWRKESGFVWMRLRDG